MRMATSRTARVVLGLLAALLTAAVLAGPATAATPSAPGSFTGYGFDACVAPDQPTMDRWNLYSPYSAIGIYVSGRARYCGDIYQPNLSKAWVQTNAANGWRFMPIHVGYQSPCYKNHKKSRVQKNLMSKSLPTARKQARSDASEAVAALKKYGFAPGSFIYLDLEWWARDHGPCDNAVREFIDAFNESVHAAKYKAGLYSSGSAAIKMTDELVAQKYKGFTPPDQIWFAWTNQKANVDGGPYLAASRWANHQRIHQYHNGVDASYAGAKLNIDKNWLDVGRGSVATKEPRPCGVAMSFSRYPSLKPGAKGPEVAALQCLLRGLGLKRTVTGSYDASTRTAVDKFRASRGWSRTGYVSASVWASLFSQGKHARVIKRGSVGTDVWNAQRALVAAGKKFTISGVYDRDTVTAVIAYRTTNGLRGYSTVEASVWDALNRGARG